MHSFLLFILDPIENMHAFYLAHVKIEWDKSVNASVKLITHQRINRRKKWPRDLEKLSPSPQVVRKIPLRTFWALKNDTKTAKWTIFFVLVVDFILRKVWDVNMRNFLRTFTLPDLHVVSDQITKLNIKCQKKCRGTDHFQSGDIHLNLIIQSNMRFIERNRICETEWKNFWYCYRWHAMQIIIII